MAFRARAERWRDLGGHHRRRPLPWKKEATVLWREPPEVKIKDLTFWPAGTWMKFRSSASSPRRLAELRLFEYRSASCSFAFFHSFRVLRRSPIRCERTR